MKATAHILMILLGSLALSAHAGPPFGTQEDQKYANKLWNKMENADLVGKGAVFSHPYKGTPPHGEVLDTLYANIRMRGNGEKPLIIKRNYRGKDISPTKVANDPDQYLKSVTVMYKRDGYDPANKDWFWVKYKPNGDLLTNPKGMKLAGRVAKGMNKGCIACHKAASGGDYVFGTNRIQ